VIQTHGRIFKLTEMLEWTCFASKNKFTVETVEATSLSDKLDLTVSSTFQSRRTSDFNQLIAGLPN